MKRTNGRSQEQLPRPGHQAMTPDIRPMDHPPRELPSTYRPRHPASAGHPAKPRNPAQARISGALHPECITTNPVSPDIRPPSSDIQTLAKSRTSYPMPGNQDQPYPESIRTAQGQPGHPARRPDIRPPLSAHSVGPRPMYPFDHLDYI